MTNGIPLFIYPCNFFQNSSYNTCACCLFCTVVGNSLGNKLGRTTIGMRHFKNFFFVTQNSLTPLVALNKIFDMYALGMLSSTNVLLHNSTHNSTHIE